MEPNIAVIVQARMGASRLPGKMLLPLHGIPIVEWVFRRGKKAKLIHDVIFAIPKTEDNDILNDFLDKKGAMICRGSEEDVVERFYFAVDRGLEIKIKEKLERLRRLDADDTDAGS